MVGPGLLALSRERLSESGDHAIRPCLSDLPIESGLRVKSSPRRAARRHGVDDVDGAGSGPSQGSDDSPPGGPSDVMPSRLFAIGDIHGCATALRTLIAAIDPRPEDTIVLLGDVIDW